MTDQKMWAIKTGRQLLLPATIAATEEMAWARLFNPRASKPSYTAKTKRLAKECTDKGYRAVRVRIEEIEE